MKSTILVAGFACLTLAAVAQSSGSKEQAPTAAPVVSPRDAASGQATGKRMHKPITVTAEAGMDAPAKDAAKAPKKTAADDWQTKSAPSSTPQIKRVAAADVDGDGKADAAASQHPSQASGQNSAINNSHSNIKSPRDLATGQASGKRAAQPATGTNGHDPEPAPKK